MLAMRLLRLAWLVDINEIAALKFVTMEKDACESARARGRSRSSATRLPRACRCCAVALARGGRRREPRHRRRSLAHADPAPSRLAAQVLGARWCWPGPRARWRRTPLTGAMSTARAPTSAGGNPLAGGRSGAPARRSPSLHPPRRLAIVAAAAQVASTPAGSACALPSGRRGRADAARLSGAGRGRVGSSWRRIWP
jgi:hypothetical protein